MGSIEKRNLVKRVLHLDVSVTLWVVFSSSSTGLKHSELLSPDCVSQRSLIHADRFSQQQLYKEGDCYSSRFD